MVICADETEGEERRVELCRPVETAQIGERLFLEGMREKFPEDEVPKPPNSKVVSRVLKKLATNEEGVIVYNGIRLMTESGPL